MLDPFVAEDLAQETFLRLYRTPPPELTSPGPWLARVAANLAYNHMRGEKNRLRRESKCSDGDMDDRIPVEDAVLRSQEINQVQKVLDALPPRDRICLLLRFSGTSYAEIAQVIGVEKSSIGTILARALKRCKKEYLHRNGGD